MTSISLKKVSVFILIIGILCTCLFGCTDKPASGSDVTSTTESTTKGEESTTLGDESGNEEDSSVHKEKSPVKKDDETTTKKKTNVKESSTKKVDKETTTKGTTTTESTTEAYTPTPLVPLTAEQELKIKEDYLEYRIAQENDSSSIYNNLTSSDIEIKKYFGTYQGCVVFFVYDPGIVYADECIEREIAGFVFDYAQNRSTDVYRDGEFTTLQDAYARGWLSNDNIRDIHYYHVPY